MRGEYYYTITHDDEGKRVLNGPYPTEYRAQLAKDNMDRGGDVICLPTRSLSRATQMIKGKTYEESGDLERSSQEIRHRL